MSLGNKNYQLSHNLLGPTLYIWLNVKKKKVITGRMTVSCKSGGQQQRD